MTIIAGQDNESLPAKKVKISEQSVVLQEYYYGEFPANKEAMAKTFRADMALKCHICKKVFMSNVQLMKHLSLHVESQRQSAVDLVDLHQCRLAIE